MSCKFRRLIVLFVLSAIALHQNCSTFSARSEREGYSGESSFNRIRRASSNPDVSTDFPNRPRGKNIPLQSSKVVYDLRSKNDEKTPTRSSHKKAFEHEDGFQGDDPVLGRPGDFRNTYRNGPSDVWVALPMVHCSDEAMTLTATVRELRHVFVDRVNAAPLPLFQVPTYCGYSVWITQTDLVLTAPYDGCYVRQENGSYVLALHLWGSPFKISCPITSVVSHPTPSVLCSQFGMVVVTEGARQTADKHGVKVNEYILPLLSKTCAHRVRSPSDVVLLHVSFGSKCVTVTDGKAILNIILDGKQFTLSCPLPYHLTSRPLPYLPSPPFLKPPQPNQDVPAFPPVPVTVRQPKIFKPDSSKPEGVPYCPYERPAVPQFPYISHDMRPIHQTQEGQYPVLPHPPYAPYPISCPPYPELFCLKYPMLYHQPVTTTASPSIQPTPWIPMFEPTVKPHIQETTFTQIPIFPPTTPAKPPKRSPSLICSKNRLMVTLPSARMDSIKVKDVKKNTWMSIRSVPLTCNYTLHLSGDSVELSSPLPSCHTHKKSPTVISLYVRFWDSFQLQLRTLLLQCHYIGDGEAQPTVPPLKPLHQNVVCSSQNMTVKLPPGPTSALFVQTVSSEIKTEAVPILEAPSYCGYSVKRDDDDGAITVLLPYSSCHMTLEDGQYRIILKYQTKKGLTAETLLSCQTTFSQECNVDPEQQLVCGSGDLSSSECHDRGCCYSEDTLSCYYPMDECTLDRHFVFSVHSSVADPPLSPANLVTAGNSPCTPHKVTADLAIFKIPLDECGVHRFEVGKTVTYMVEILNRKQPLTLNFGTITRDSSVRLLVECRYLPGSVASVGYLVKSPSLGPTIKAEGVFGVQLRIAKDELYSSFYPQYHLPLHMLLGKPLYLEVRLLNPPDPTATLLVHYCVVYPRSAKSAWILIYDGCPNVLDQTPTPKPPPTPAEGLTNHVRRFTVSTFQFMSEDAKTQADEELYFMCSTEVCLPSDGPCLEGCFADPSVLKDS